MMTVIIEGRTIRIPQEVEAEGGSAIQAYVDQALAKVQEKPKKVRAKNNPDQE